MKPDFKNLFVISYGAIGDFCMLLYFLERVHRGAPGARLVVVATRGGALLREMAAQYPFIEVVPTTPWPLGRLFLQTAGGRNMFVIPPTFVDVPYVVRSLAALLTFGSGTVAGFTGRARGPHYAVSVPFETHSLFYENLAALLSKLGLPADGTPMLSFVEDSSIADNLGEGYVALAPFASNPGKTLPRERWIALLQFLRTQYPQRRVAIVGGPTEREAAQALVTQSGHSRAQVVCGASFAAAAVVHRAACFIGADSGLTHVASVLRVPSVIIDNLRAVTWLPTYNANATILTEPRDCQCHGDKTGNCYREIGGIRYLRCMIDVPQGRIEEAVTHTLTHD